MKACIFTRKLGANFLVASNLRRHLKTHSGEKSNKCNQCDYACSDPSALRSHLKTHTGEKSNKCNQCDYASSEAGDLRRHLKTHTGEKSNNCRQCNFVSSCLNALIHAFENTQWMMTIRCRLQLMYICLL